MMKKLIYIVLLISIGCQSEIYRDENGIVKCQEGIEIGFIGESDGVSYKVVDRKMLKKMIKNDEDLRFICTTKITDMSEMFYGSGRNGKKFSLHDISNWDVSNVTNMSGMFFLSKFQGDISNWDVSNVTNMSAMFRGDAYHKKFGTQFQGDISKWDVSNVTNMDYMFYLSSFKGDISNWDISNVTNMSGVFEDCPIANENMPFDY